MGKSWGTLYTKEQLESIAGLQQGIGGAGAGLEAGGRPPGQFGMMNETYFKPEYLDLSIPAVRKDFLGDGHHVCPECHRAFLNNISCPRCGWRMPR